MKIKEFNNNKPKGNNVKEVSKIKAIYTISIPILQVQWSTNLTPLIAWMEKLPCLMTPYQSDLIQVSI